MPAHVATPPTPLDYGTDGEAAASPIRVFPPGTTATNTYNGIIKTSYEIT